MLAVTSDARFQKIEATRTHPQAKNGASIREVRPVARKPKCRLPCSECYTYKSILAYPKDLASRANSAYLRNPNRRASDPHLGSGKPLRYAEAGRRPRAAPRGYLQANCFKDPEGAGVPIRKRSSSSVVRCLKAAALSSALTPSPTVTKRASRGQTNRHRDYRSDGLDLRRVFPPTAGGG
jgi:hypothetical protein